MIISWFITPQTEKYKSQSKAIDHKIKIAKYEQIQIRLKLAWIILDSTLGINFQKKQKRIHRFNQIISMVRNNKIMISWERQKHK